MFYVIGSGPSGISVTKALLDLGREVTMLDYGLTLENDRLSILNELRQMTSEQWPPEKIAFLKGEAKVSKRGVEYKNIFGSDFPYRDADFLEIPKKGIEVKPSLAAGGLSNVWGAAILPATKHDLSDWPVSFEDLSLHYKAVLAFQNVCGRRDDLENYFPLFIDRLENLRLSKQGQELLEIMESNKQVLRQTGFHIGQARLALRANKSPEGPGCVYCGLCLYGCPYDLIYNSFHTVRQLKDNPKFTYRPHLNIQTVEETPNGIAINGLNKDTKERVVLKGDRVYLATGPFSTTRIIMESKSAFEREIHLKTSQYFMVPFLSQFSVKNVPSEPLHALTQIFIELMDEAISSNTIHLQFYSYNEMYQSYFKKKLGIMSRLASPLIDHLLGKLFIIQSFLHSNDSSLMAAKLKKRDNRAILALHPIIKDRPREIVNKVMKKFKRFSKWLGGTPLTPVLHFGALGDGNHTGGSFPMRQNPGEFETDIAGRPFGFKRVHVVDSCVMPSIPGTTITLTIMANAHRIGSMEKEL